MQCDVSAHNPLHTNDCHKPGDFLEAGNLYLEKIECMVRGLKEAEDDHNLMKEIVENGIYSSIRGNLPEGHEDKMKQLFAAGYQPGN